MTLPLVVGVDGSDSCLRAVDWAVGLAVSARAHGPVIVVGGSLAMPSALRTVRLPADVRPAGDRTGAGWTRATTTASCPGGTGRGNAWSPDG